MEWYLLAVDLPVQPGAIEGLWDKFLNVPIEVWGVIFSFAGALYYVIEKPLWSTRRKVFASLFGTMIGWSMGYAIQKGLNFAALNFLVYTGCGVIGFNFAGGLNTIGGNFKLRPFKTIAELADTYKKVKDVIRNKDEKPNDSIPDDRVHGRGEPDGES